MAIPILQTKLYMPAPGPALLPRPRLMEQLERGRQARHRLILVSAQAGSGKTTLLSAWLSAPAGLSTPAGPTAWLSLDEDDNDPARFWAYVVAAFQTANLALDLPLPASFDSPAVQAWLIALLNALNAQPASVCLVLDDYHVIVNAAIHAALAFLVERLPASAQLVLATRGDPPLPLGRLRVRQQLTEVRAADLRFTPEEAALFLNRGMGLHLAPDEVAALEARTEGWAAGLQLAALALTASSATGPAAGPLETQTLIAAFSGSHHFVLDYLAEEVLSRQPPEVQLFLMQTSVLERLSGDLCDHVTGQSDGAARLAQLQRLNLFVLPLDAQGHWFRYHHLFADLLSHRARQNLSKDQIRELHARASQWHAQNGWLEQAVKHALAAQDFEQAAALVERAAKTTMLNGQLTTLLRWLDALPETVRLARPRLRLYDAWTHYLSGDDDLAGRLLQESQRVFQALPPSPENDALRGELATLLARSAAFAGDTVKAIEMAQTALAYLPEADHVSRARVAAALGVAYTLQGEPHQAYPAFHLAQQLALAAGSTFLAAHVFTMEGTSDFHYGQLRRAAQVFQRAVDLGGAAGQPPFFPAGEAYLGLGEVAFERNELEETAQFLQHGLELCRQGKLAGGLARGYLLQSRLRQAAGDLAGAGEALQLAEQGQPRETSDFGRVEWLAYMVRHRLTLGDVAGAARWAEQLPLLPSGEKSDLRLPVVIWEVLLLALARLYLAQGTATEALSVLERLNATAEPARRLARVIELSVLKSAAFSRQLRPALALAALQRAVELAEPEGYVRVFVEAGEAVQTLLADRGLRAALPAPQARAHLDQLLAAIPAGQPALVPTRPAASETLVEPLSRRELEVLQWLCEGYSNREIAEKLVVTVNAVKKHTSHIFGKLGVNSRTQAVARARQLGLVPDPPRS